MHSDNLSKKIQQTLVLKDKKLAEYSITPNIYDVGTAVCFVKQMKEPFPDYMLLFNFLVPVSVYKRTPLNIRRVSHLLKQAFIVVF